MHPVRFDQAVFTSASTSRGEGYRIIAASPELSSQERRGIQRCAPSHGGLCSEEPDFVSLGFVRLAGGRLAVFHSTHAGMEQTGRGGRRVYTHFLIFAPENFAAFDNNPFDILRAAAAAGVFVPDPSASGTLEPLALAPPRGTDAITNITRCINAIDVRTLHRGLTRALAGRNTLLLAAGDRNQLAEAILLAVPAPLRPGVSLATGLKFSLSRGLSLCLVDPGSAPATRFLRGSKIEMIDLAGECAPPESEAATWVDMVLELWADGAVEDVVTVSSHDRIDTSDEGLTGLAGLMLDAHRVPRGDLPSLIERCTHRAARVPRTQLEGEVLERFWARAGHRLVELWPVPQDDAARTHWHILAELPRRNPFVPGLIGESLLTLLTRIATVDPVDALARALLLAREPGNPWGNVVNGCEAPLLRQLAEWAARGDDPVRCEKALALAEDWHQAVPDGDVSAEVIEALAAHRDSLAVKT